jgi:ornithine decarboxylase
LREIFLQQTIDELREYSNRIGLKEIISSHDSPLLLLDLARVKVQYQALQKALPMVDHHFAIKALRHPAVITTIEECDGFFDVMTKGDTDLVAAQNISLKRCIHTNPIKQPREIEYAYKMGITTFVVDNPAEVDKFVAYANDIQLLIRLSFPNPQAKSDLSFKFGVPPEEAENLVAYTLKKGLKVAGFAMHVGSQIHAAQAYSTALIKVTELIAKVEHDHAIKLEMLDIGGGFPVNYLEPSPSLQEIADVITPLIEPLTKRMRIISEPGRFIVAPAMTLITQIVGKSVRHGTQWYYINDGLYGSYSNIIYEQVHAPIFALKEIEGTTSLSLRPCAVAGPTCDSVDVVSIDCPLPQLEIGDYLVSPMMGAYTAASSTDFNGIPRTKIIVI